MPRATEGTTPIAIKIDVNRWADQPQEQQQLLLWFHQYMVDHKMSLKQGAVAINYNYTSVSKILRGKYEGGNMERVCKAIEGYKKIITDRGTITEHETVGNSITELISNGLDYALSNSSITLILGASRMGKTVSAKAWRDSQNHGRSVFVTAPPFGGVSALLKRIGNANGIVRHHSALTMLDELESSFNKNRILIIDEAHRLLPADARTPPTSLEVLRDLRDLSGCALAFISTQRFDDTLRKSNYMYEQILGRVGMPITLPSVTPWEDIKPIVSQYVEVCTPKLRAECKRIANAPGRMGILVETLKVASRVAAKRKKPLDEEIFFSALALRNKMMGATVKPKK